MKNSLRIHKWTHNEFNIFILGVLTRPLFILLYKPCCFMVGLCWLRGKVLGMFFCFIVFCIFAL